MNHLLERGIRWFLAVLVVPCMLAACGPGGGGTGTGPLTFSGTSFQGLVASSAPGNCNPQCGVADLVVEDTLVRFASDCRLFSFVGAWKTDAQGAVALHGELVTTVGASKVTVPSALELKFSEGQPDSQRATALLRDDQGQVVLGPFNLQRGAGVSPAFGSCPGR